jgi:hypothetical protein
MPEIEHPDCPTYRIDAEDLLALAAEARMYGFDFRRDHVASKAEGAKRFIVTRDCRTVLLGAPADEVIDYLRDELEADHG